jgi:hypothetical protein
VPVLDVSKPNVGSWRLPYLKTLGPRYVMGQRLGTAAAEIGTFQLVHLFHVLLFSLTSKATSSTPTDCNRMPKALILVTDGSEEIEFVTPYDGTSTQS